MAAMNRGPRLDNHVIVLFGTPSAWAASRSASLPSRWPRSPSSTGSCQRLRARRGGLRPPLRMAPRDRDTHHLPPDSKRINHGTSRHRPRNHRPQRLARAPLARVTAHASGNPRAAGRGLRRPPRLASGRPAGAARLPPRGSPSASSADTGRSPTLIAVLMMWSAGSPMKLNPCCRQAQPVQQPTDPSKFTADDRTQQ